VNPSDKADNFQKVVDRSSESDLCINMNLYFTLASLNLSWVLLPLSLWLTTSVRQLCELQIHHKQCHDVRS